METRPCTYCGEPLTGRTDKRFCNPYCKSAYHYGNNKTRVDVFFVKVDKQLRLNRRLLKHFNQAGKATIRAEDLLKHGFNPRFSTHQWLTANGNLYRFCYEFGFMTKQENGKEKYVLVKWQPYMLNTSGQTNGGSFAAVC